MTQKTKPHIAASKDLIISSCPILSKSGGTSICPFLVKSYFAPSQARIARAIDAVFVSAESARLVRITGVLVPNIRPAVFAPQRFVMLL